MGPHSHRWKHFSGMRFECEFKGCNTVTDFQTIITNVESITETRVTLGIYSQQLFDGDLRKPAHDRVLAWVREHNPDGLTIDEAVLKQASLL